MPRLGVERNLNILTRFTVTGIILLGILFAQPSGYQYRKKLIIDPTQVSGTTSLTNFPALISFTHNDLRSTANGGGVANPSGYDIVFTASDGSTLLDHQLEKYTATIGALYFWVRIPTLSAAANTEIYVYFGNSAIFSDQSTTTTWNSNYLAVWHLNTNISDATANGHTLTDNSTTAVTTGIVAGAREFTGDGDDLSDAAAAAYLNGLDAFSISMWVKSDVTGTDRGMFYGDVPDGNDLLLGMRYDASGTSGGGTNIVHGMVKVGNNNKMRYESSSSVQTTSWQNLAFTKLSGTAMVLYINGALDTPTYSNSKSGTTSGNGTLKIGKGSKDGTTSSWDGLIDEVRISNVARSADWMTTEYNTINSPATFFAVDATNEAAILVNIEATVLAYQAGSAATIITTAITTFDYSDLNLESATVQITTNYVSTEDVLAFTNQNGISGSWDSGTGTMTLTGTASLANFQTALRSVTYQNTAGTPSTSTRTVVFTVNDGTADSNTQSRDISISITNSAPVLSSIEGTALAYTDGDPATAITSTLVVTDSDDSYLDSAWVEFSANYVNGEDLLAFANTASLTGTWSSSTGSLLITGSASIADYQTALRSVTYENNNPDPSTTTRTVDFIVSDGSLHSNTASRNITITPTNDAPDLAGIETAPLTYNPGDGAVNITATLTASDGDNTSFSGAVVQITGNFLTDEDMLAFVDQNGITGSWNAITGAITLSGSASITNYQTALRSITYENTATSPSFSTRAVSFYVDDGSANSDTLSRNIAWGTPGTISDLQLWLRSDVGVYSDAGVTEAVEGNSVVQWNDQSGNNRNFSAAVKKPVYRASSVDLNNAAALDFIGNKDYLYDDDGELYINGMTAFTLMMVIKSDATGVDDGFIIASDPSGSDQYFTVRYDATGDISGATNVIRTSIISNSTSNQIESAAEFQTTSGQIVELEWESGNVYDLWVDGVLNNPSASPSPPSGAISSADQLIIGRGSQNNNDSWDGLIAEVILYNRHISETERTSVEDYLSQKYGISVRLLEAATGGEEISADDANNNFTTLSGPRLTEDYIGEFPLNGTLVLNAPSGYEWDTGGATPTVTVQPAYGSSTTLQASYTSRSTSQVTFTIAQASNATGKPGELQISGLLVRPTTGVLPNTGNITNSGTIGETGTTNYGTLTMVAGTKTSLIFVQQPSATTLNDTITPASTVQLTDQFGNDVAEASVTITMALASGTGTLDGTLSQATSDSGLATFSDLWLNDIGTKTISASSTGLTGVTSNSFTVNSDGVFTTFKIERESGGNILAHTAGETFNIKISAIDSYETVDINFTGTVDITSTGTLGTGSGTTASFTAGVLASHTVSITNTGTFMITATNSSGSETGNSNAFAISPGTASAVTSTIAADPTILVNNGTSTATITVQVKDAYGNNLTTGSATVNLLASAGSLLGSITNNGNGTYTQILQSSLNIETATITGVLNSVAMTDNAQVMFNSHTNEWQSSVGDDALAVQWEYSSNWTSGVPGASDVVLIPQNPSVGTKQPVIAVDDQSIESIVVESGADVTINGGISFTITGDINGGGEINGTTSDSILVGGDIDLGNFAIGAVILNGSTTQSLTGADSYTNLEINNSVGVSASTDLTVSGTLYLTGGTLALASGYSLIANTESVTGGTIQMNREIIGSTGWRLLSAPLISTYGDFLDAIFTQGYTGSDSADGSPSVLYYDETFAGTDNQRWRAPSNSTDATVPGRGLFTYVFGDIAADPAYSNPLPVTLSVDGQQDSGSGGTFDFGVTYTTTADTGWNLVGNPFCAAIDWDGAGWTKTNIDNSIYVWDNTINSGNGGYLTWNGVTGSLGDGLIPPFQGFWIKANSASPVLSVALSNKTNGGVFYKTLAEKTPIIMLLAENDTLSATTYLMFDSLSSLGTDTWDAYRLIPFTDTYIDIYSINSHNKQMAINSLPGRFGIPFEVPLDITAYTEGNPVAGSYTVMWPKMENIPAGWIVELVDRNTGVVVDLALTTSYEFEKIASGKKLSAITPDSSGIREPLQLLKKQSAESARFLLRIDPGNNNPDIPRKFALNNTYPNPFNAQTWIPVALPLESQVTLKIHNLLGRQVAVLANNVTLQAGIHNFEWKPRQLSSGLYFVTLYTDDRVFIKKMMLVK